MAGDELLQPTIHVEVLVKGDKPPRPTLEKAGEALARRLREDYVAIEVGQQLDRLRGLLHEELFSEIEIVDYTGPENPCGIYNLSNVELDVQMYVLNDTKQHRTVRQVEDDATSQTRIRSLPDAALHGEWNSLVFDDRLPARLLRYLVRMMRLLRQPGLKLSTFNWNRLFLLHGPPGSGKSTLCRALAQKLAIRLGHTFNDAVLIEINANAMLSKYFGESGKNITATFNGIINMAQDSGRLICVVIDEIETIAGSRQRLTNNNECHDGLRATNQLLTALDQLRLLPNVLVLCTSNLIEAIDPAFLDRVDMKQMVPTPSPAAIYNIFRSCINEMIRSGVIGSGHSPPHQTPPSRPVVGSSDIPSSPDSWTIVHAPSIPSFSEMQVRGQSAPAGSQVWTLAQKCHGFSGRTLRRLPVLGMAMYTWGGDCTLHDALSALEAAIDQEWLAAKAM